MILDVGADLLALLVGGKFLHLQFVSTLVNCPADRGWINTKIGRNLGLRILSDALGMFEEVLFDHLAFRPVGEVVAPITPTARPTPAGIADSRTISSRRRPAVAVAVRRLG